MGWIVGKKGSYIGQLCEKSGARITISESTSREFGIVWKYVQISGSGREVDKAKKLIHIRLDRLDRGATGGGGGRKKSRSLSGSDEAAPLGGEGGRDKEGGSSSAGPPGNRKRGAGADLRDEA